jgi:HD-like signal output (HDOD) protein
MPDRYQDATDGIEFHDVRFVDAEERVMGCTHADVGAYLLGLWGLPHSVVKAVAWHHRPPGHAPGGLSIEAAVHAADALARERLSPDDSGVDMEYLAQIGLAGRWSVWKDACAGLNA